MRRNSFAALILVIAALVLVFLAGCQTNDPTAGDAFGKYAREIDRLQKIHEKYGSVTFSTPVLVRQSDQDYFKFDLPDQNAETYFSHAKSELQGRAAVRSEKARVTSFGVSLQADLTQMAAGGALVQQYLSELQDYYLKKANAEERSRLIDGIKMSVAKEKLDLALAAAKMETDTVKQQEAINAALEQFEQDLPELEAPESFPEYPTADSSNLPETDSDLSNLPEKAREYIGNLQFAEHMGLLGEDKAVTNRDRTAIITSAGDVTVEGILRVLGDVEKAQQFKDKHVLYGVSMVSVQPGWRTRRDFEANLAVQVKLDYRPIGNSERARLKSGSAELPDLPSIDGCSCIPSRQIPAVAAVSPMTDIQNLDLANSRREALERAFRIQLALQYFGIKGGSSFFNDYIKRLEQDIHTRSAQIPIAAYSTGNLFGYRIGPSLTALSEPGKANTQSGYELQNQSFPVLIIIGLDKSDLDLIQRDPCQMKGKIVCRPQLRLDQTVSWIPRTRSAEKDRLSASELLMLSKDIYDADRSVQEDTAVRELADVKLSALKSLTFGSIAWQEIPEEMISPAVAPKAAKIEASVGGTIVLPRDTANKVQPVTVTRIFTGRNLKALNLTSGKVILGAVTIVKASVVDGLLRVEMTVTKENPSRIILGFDQTLNNEALTMTTPPIEVEAAAKHKEVALSPEIFSADALNVALDKEGKLIQGRLVIYGSQLKLLDLKKAQLLNPALKPVPRSKLENISLKGDTVVVSDFQVEKADLPFYVRFPVNDSKGSGSVLTPLIGKANQKWLTSLCEQNPNALPCQKIVLKKEMTYAIPD